MLKEVLFFIKCCGFFIKEGKVIYIEVFLGIEY